MAGAQQVAPRPSSGGGLCVFGFSGFTTTVSCSGQPACALLLAVELGPRLSATRWGFIQIAMLRTEGQGQRRRRTCPQSVFALRKIPTTAWLCCLRHNQPQKHFLLYNLHESLHRETCRRLVATSLDSKWTMRT